MHRCLTSIALSTGVLLLAALLSLPTQAFATDQESESLNRVIEVTEAGLVPSTLDITSKDLTVFLLNNTKTSLVSFEIDYGKQEIHCSNANIKNLPNGKARSVAPLSPRDFVATCFHEPGSYPIRFYGVGGKAAPLTATVTVR
jgi:hypothetical protein